MDKRSHLMMWDQMRQRHGITLRLIEQIPADKLTSHPIAGMRTPIELIVHMYCGVEAFTDSVAKGSVGSFDDKAIAAGIQNRDQLVAYVRKAWAAGDKLAHEATEPQLQATVKTPWGEFPGFAMYGIIYDEYLHHRGQLYAFVRTFGLEPVMVWDFEHNTPEFKPRQHATS